MPNPSDQSGVPTCNRCKGSKEIPVPLPVDVGDNGGQFRPKMPCPDCPPAPAYVPRLDKSYRAQAEEILSHPDFCLLSNLLHRLWTKAVGTPGYEKSDWQTLETVLVRMDAERFARRLQANKPGPRQKITLEDAAAFCPLSSHGPNLTPVCAWWERDLMVCGAIFQDRLTSAYGYVVYHPQNPNVSYTPCAMTLAIDTKEDATRFLHLEMDRIRNILQSKSEHNARLGW
jgi:hypothetical protein